MISIEQEDGLRSALDQAFNALHAIKGTVATIERDRLQGRRLAPTDSPTETRNCSSANLLRIVLQRTIEGETLDQDCEKLIAVLSKATGVQDLHPQFVRNYDALPEEGYYRFEGDFVKVQESQVSNRLYAKKWSPANKSWEYASGLYCKLHGATPVSAEDAKQFGDLFGHCIFCGLKLTDDRSIAAGYGPTCAENRGLPWG